MDKPLLYDQLQESADYIWGQVCTRPRVGIILGTGLGGLAARIENKQDIPYSDIPHFPESTVQSHKGQFSFGHLEGQSVAVMEGRFHYYEGYSLQEVTYPVRVMKALGVEFLIISNAAGGLNPKFSKGDLMMITDHINLMGVNPLIGPNDGRLGLRFPDMIEPYNRVLLDKARQVVKKEKLKVREGVYAAMTGPCLETRAEYAMLQRLGADAIGMSTVPEAIVAVHSQLKTFAVSVLTDLCLPEALEPLVIEDVIRIANEAEPHLTALVAGLVREIAGLRKDGA